MTNKKFAFSMAIALIISVILFIVTWNIYGSKNNNGEQKLTTTIHVDTLMNLSENTSFKTAGFVVTDMVKFPYHSPGVSEESEDEVDAFGRCSTEGAEQKTRSSPPQQILSIEVKGAVNATILAAEYAKNVVIPEPDPGCFNFNLKRDKSEFQFNALQSTDIEGVNVLSFRELELVNGKTKKVRYFYAVAVGHNCRLTINATNPDSAINIPDTAKMRELLKISYEMLTRG